MSKTPDHLRAAMPAIDRDALRRRDRAEGGTRLRTDGNDEDLRFTGLVTAARRVEADGEGVCIVERALDCVGTEYGNRYPREQCDTASMVHGPRLEEAGHRPSEKHVHAAVVTKRDLGTTDDDLGGPMTLRPAATNVARQPDAAAAPSAGIEAYAGGVHGGCALDSAVDSEPRAKRAWARLPVLFETALA
jgi:hypothetical protein